LPSPRGLGSAIATTASIWSSILGWGEGWRAEGGSRQQIRGLSAHSGAAAGASQPPRVECMHVHALRSGGGGVSQLEKRQPTGQNPPLMAGCQLGSRFRDRRVI
jgi:hypothetical protein